MPANDMDKEVTIGDYPQTTMNVTLVVAVTIAVTGFFIGVRQVSNLDTGSTSPALIPDDATAGGGDAADDSRVLPAVSYSEIRNRGLQANRDWSTQLSSLATPQPTDWAKTDHESASPDEFNRAVAKRSERRAFAGAPPVVPHPIHQQDVNNCLECHGSGRKIDTINAPMMSHPAYANCTQCHAESFGDRNTNDKAWAKSLFTGFPGYGSGSRAGPAAPPTVPHPTWMRQNCMSCHGVHGSHGLKAAHPWRQNCVQCHASSAELDQVGFIKSPQP